MYSNYENPASTPKVAIQLMGDKGVGTTSLISGFLGNDFMPSVLEVSDVSSGLRQVDDKNVQIAALNQIDPSQQQRNVQRLGCNNVMLLFDLTKLETYNHLKQHLDTVNRYFPKNTIVTVVGTKSDLHSDKTLTRDEVEGRMKHECKDKGLHFAGYIETSSKDDKNVQAAFTLAAKERLKVDAKYKAAENPEASSSSKMAALQAQHKDALLALKKEVKKEANADGWELIDESDAEPPNPKR